MGLRVSPLAPQLVNPFRDLHDPHLPPAAQGVVTFLADDVAAAVS
jgi:hypothetical protein